MMYRSDQYVHHLQAITCNNARITGIKRSCFSSSEMEGNISRSLSICRCLWANRQIPAATDWMINNKSTGNALSLYCWLLCGCSYYMTAECPPGPRASHAARSCINEVWFSIQYCRLSNYSISHNPTCSTDCQYSTVDCIALQSTVRTVQYVQLHSGNQISCGHAGSGS